MRIGGRAGALRSARSVLICGCRRFPVAHIGNAEFRYSSGGLRARFREKPTTNARNIDTALNGPCGVMEDYHLKITRGLKQNWHANAGE